jgi:hypothetical protein
MTTPYQKIKIPHMNNLPVPFKNKISYPQPPEKSQLPNNFYTALVVGGTGSGKTYSVVKLLKYYEEYKIYNDQGEEVPQRIWLLSPSYESNPIFTSLKYLDEDDIVNEYSDAKLQEVLDEIKQVKIDAEAYQEELKEYRKFIKAKRVNDLSPKTLLTLHKLDFEPPIPPKYKINPINYLVLDDLINSSAYKSTGKSLINSLAVRNRHLGINLFILAQSAPQIPKTVRSQARLLFIYRYNSKSIIDDLHELVSAKITPEQFEQIYMDATEERFNFLTIDNTKKDLILKQNLDTLIVLNKDKVEKLKKKKDKELKENE